MPKGTKNSGTGREIFVNAITLLAIRTAKPPYFKTSSRPSTAITAAVNTFFLSFLASYRSIHKPAPQIQSPVRTIYTGEAAQADT